MAGEGRSDVSSLGVAALDEPSVYPGLTPEFSYVLLGRQVVPLESCAKRLGDWRAGSGGESSLDELLQHSGASSVDQRTAVLAFGSNASPPQLARKFAGVPGSAIPVVKGWAYGLRLAFSAHINPVGYIPAAVRSSRDPTSRLPVWLTFLDPEQLKVMDPTEPSYRRIVLSYGEGRPVAELESGEFLEACCSYRTQWGVLDLEACDDLGLISQLALRALLEGRSGPLAGLFEPSTTVRPASIGLASVPGLGELGLVSDDGLEDFISDRSAVYGALGSYRPV